MTPRARLSPATALAALVAIAAAGAAIVGLSVSRGDSGATSIVSGHGHGGTIAVAATPEEQRRARELIASTEAGIAPYANVADAEAAGYRWIGDGTAPGEYRHYVQPWYLLDSDILDPERAESLVYRTEPDGGLTLVSAMYILPPGTTLADAPDVAGGLAPWHDHTDLCWGPDGVLSGTTSTGVCADGSTPRPTPPMLHVWVVDNPDGPFAGIEGHGG